MRRRGLWLFAGAVLGIAGYRRAQRAGRALTGDSQRALAGKQSALVPALGSALAKRQSAGSARRPVVGLVQRAAGTAKFVKDVRAGMAEYRMRHADPSGSTLSSQDRSGTEGIVQPRQHRRVQQESEQDRQAL